MEKSSKIATSPPLLEVSGLYKSFGVTNGNGSMNQERVVLMDINFSVQKGAFVCFVGPSGCGKSTLFNILAGFETQTAGSVLVNGSEARDGESKSIFVFQEDGLFPWMTAYENIEIGVRDEPDPAKRRSTVEEYVELVGLGGAGNLFPHELSGGMRRRAEVARALITNPDILFMDEPFAALDFLTRLQMREEMVNVHAMFPITILFITHDIDEALQLADQIIVLSEQPTTIKADIPIEFPRPRDFTRPELAKLRKKIYFYMGLHAAL